MIIKGAKAGQQKAHKPVISKDTVASTSTAKILYGLSEGEVYGLAEGAKSIRLDGTPLLDSDGNANFDDIAWDFRTGTNEQKYIKGFPDVNNEKSVNVELTNDTHWVQAINNIQLSAVRVRLKWGRLSRTKENGDVVGHRIDYAIDLKTDGSTYQTVQTHTINDKASNGYKRTHRIDLPNANAGWQIRVRRLTANSDSDLVQDKMYIDAFAEVIDVKLRYPNTALLGLQYDAETFQNIAKVAVRVKGKIINVPSNYDPTSREYTGLWDGTFKQAYSNNPAWIYYDLCTAKRYGLGDRLDASMVDKWSLYQLGRYCDELVDDGNGGQEPRFACNVYLQKQADAYTVLSNIAGIFRSMSYWNGERVIIDADVPQDPVYTFSRANVTEGNFEYTGTRQRDRHTVAKVGWDNPNNDYKTEYEFIREEKAIAKFGVKVADISAIGCTSQGQAQRAGLWALKTEQLETRQVSFSVGLDGVIPQVGNIINVSDELFAGRASGGRVSAVSDKQYVITIDRDVTVNTGDILVVNGSHGRSERRTIKSVASRKITVNAPFEYAERENVWAIEFDDLKLMRFRVMSITESEDNTYAITAIQHQPQKYDAIDYGADIKQTAISVVSPDLVSAPVSVSLSARHRIVQAQTIATLVVAWEQVSDAVAYDVEWRKDDGTWIKLPRTSNTSVEIEGVYGGKYLARVRAVSAFDVQSKPAVSQLTAIDGKAGKPTALATLTATGILFGMQLNWKFASGSGDTDYVEIQVGSAPDTNVTTLGNYSYPTDTATINGLQGGLTQYYRGRVVDKLGFKSDWSAWTSSTVDDSADKVLELLNGEITESQLHSDLGAKVSKIEANEQAIEDEIQARITAVKSANTTRANQVAELQNKVSKETLDRINAINEANKAISDENAERLTAITQLNNEIITASETLSNDIANEARQRLEQTTELTEKFDGVYAQVNPLMAGDNSELIGDAIFVGVWSETSARIEDDMALGKRIDGLSASLDGNLATITKHYNVLTDADKALAQSINILQAESANNSALITSNYKSLADTSKSLSQNLTNLQTDYDDNIASINNQLSTLSDDSSSQSASIFTLSAEIDTAQNTANTAVDKADKLSADIISERHARVAGDEANSKQVDALVTQFNNNKAQVTSKLQTLSDNDSVLIERVDNMQSQVNADVANLSASIDSKYQLLTQADSSIASKLDGVYAQVNPLMAGDSSELLSSAVMVGVWSETSARIEDDMALGARIDNVSASMGDSISQVTQTTKVTADKLSSLATQVNVISAAQSGNLSLVMNEFYTKTDTNQAISNAVEVFKADYVVPELGKKASASSLADTQTQVTNIDNQLEVASTKIDGVYAQVNPDMAGNADDMAGDSTIFVGVWSETSARIEDDMALGKRIDGLSASLDGSSALIEQNYQTLVTADKALAQGVETLNTSFNNNKSRIEQQLQTLTTDNDSQASEILQLVSSVSTAQNTANTAVSKANSNTSIISKEAKTRADKDSVLSTRLDSVTATANNNRSLIQTEQRTSASEREAIAQDVKTLQTATGENRASIQTQATTLNGLSAQYTVKLDVNGRVSGFGLASSSNSSDFAIRADKFYIAPPDDTGKGDSPFVVLTTAQTINGTTVPAGTYIKSAYIQNASIDSVKIKNGSITTAKIGNAQVDTAQIRNGAIKAAKIGTAQVSTLQIAGEAVIVPRVQFTASPFEFYTIDREEEINRLTLDAKGGSVSIAFAFESLLAYASGDNYGDNGKVYIRIKRGDKLLRTFRFVVNDRYAYSSYTSDGSIHYNYKAKITERFITLPTILDTPPTGTQTYTVTLESRGLNAGKNSSHRATKPVRITARSLHIIGARR